MRYAVGLLTCFLLVFVFFVLPVRAEVISDELVVIKADQVIDDDLFVGGETVKIEGTVNGDVYAGAGKLDVSGVINGDLLAGGGTIEISGQIKDDVLVAGGDISFRGAQVGDSVNIGGGNVDLDEQTVIGGGLVFGAGNVESDAKVGRGITGGGGRVEINGPVGKYVSFGGGELFLGEKARIGGDLWYSSENEAFIDQEASITGGITYQPYKNSNTDSEKFKHGLKGLGWGFRIWSWLGASVVGLVLLRLMPKWSEKVVKQLQISWGSDLIAGFLYSILVIPLFLVLLATMIGVLLAIIWLLVFGLAVYVSKILAGYCLGFWLKTKLNLQFDNRYLVMLLGLLAWYVLRSIPFGIGWIVGTGTMFWALGAMVLVLKENVLDNK